MATADGVKNKIQSLINTVNQKAGATHTDLTGAVNYLLNGTVIQGVVKQYRAHAGVTAGSFVEFVKGWGSGTVTGTAATALSVVSLSDSRVVAVYPDSDKKVRAVMLTIYDDGVTKSGETIIADSTGTTCLSAVAISDTHVLVAYNCGTSTGKVIVLRALGATLEQGQSITFHQGSVQRITTAKLSADQAIISYTLGSDAYSCPGSAIVASVSGLTISLGPSTVYADLAHIQKVVTLNPSKALVVYCNPEQDSEVAGMAKVLLINGNKVQASSAYNFRNALIRDLTAVALSDTKVLVSYTFSYKVKTEVLTINGEIVIAGRDAYLDESTSGNTPALVALSGNKALAVWNSTGGTKAAVLTYYAPTLTIGALQPLRSGTALNKIELAASSEQSAFVAWATGTATSYRGAMIDGNDITLATGLGGNAVQPATTNKAIAGVAASSGAAGEAVDVYRVTASDDNGLIPFTIGGTAYRAVEGMTWAEWISSEYGDRNFIINSDNTLVVGSSPALKTSSGATVYASDALIEGEAYTFA